MTNLVGYNDFAGKLVEFDQPSKLMETDSSFSKLVADFCVLQLIPTGEFELVASHNYFTTAENRFQLTPELKPSSGEAIRSQLVWLLNQSSQALLAIVDLAIDVGDHGWVGVVGWQWWGGRFERSREKEPKKSIREREGRWMCGENET
ncbi:hypothetical protein LguiB_008410 [Lonicera macranthoides]